MNNARVLESAHLSKARLKRGSRVFKELAGPGEKYDKGRVIAARGKSPLAPPQGAGYAHAH